ncbi:MAG: hypothetical protein DLM54_10030 [Acidimicrobiales bacterium]|nr:MAG: hypothetical protein DLM54_10030 [Acidimicrobiales bacterium]
MPDIGIACEDLAEVRRLAATGAARRIREEARLSLAEVADDVGTALVNISRWELGTRRPRGPEALRWLRLLRRLERAA